MPRAAVEVDPDRRFGATEHTGDLRNRGVFEVMQRQALRLPRRQSAHRRPEVGRVVRERWIGSPLRSQSQQRPKLHSGATPQRPRTVDDHAAQPRTRLVVRPDLFPAAMRVDECVLYEVLADGSITRQRGREQDEIGVLPPVEVFERLREFLGRRPGTRYVDPIADHDTHSHECLERLTPDVRR